MNYRSALPLLILLSVLPFCGCRRGAPPVVSPASPGQEDGISLQELTDTYRLELTSDPASGRYVLTGEGVELTLIPGLTTAYCNGRRIVLPFAPAMRGGQLWLSKAALKVVPESLKRRRADGGVVILDPGHGGRDSGAVAHGLQEKTVVLDVAKRAAKLLRGRGLTVKLTRSDDTFLTLEERSRIANRQPGALMISIHANSDGVRGHSGAQGVETFVLEGNVSEDYRVKTALADYVIEEKTAAGSATLPATQARQRIRRMSGAARSDSRRLARSVQTELVHRLGEKDRRVKEANYAVLRETYFGPAILTEIGFLTDRATARKLGSPAYRQRIAEAIAAGVIDYLAEN